MVTALATESEVVSAGVLLDVPVWLAWYAETSEISTCWTTNRSSAQAVAPPAESVRATAPATTARRTRLPLRGLFLRGVMPHL